MAVFGKSAKVGSAYIEIRGDSSKLDADLGKAKKQVSSLAAGASKAAMGGVTTALKTLVGAYAAAQAASIAFATKSLQKFADYEQAVIKMRNVTNESMEKMRSDIGKMPANLGTSTELFKGYYQVISAGITDVAKAQEMLITASKMSKTTNIDQFTSVRALSKVMLGYKDSLKSSADAADLLFGIERAGQTTVTELAQYIGGIANMAGMMKVPMSEFGAALAQITQSAGDTAEATTQLQGLMMAMVKPTKDMTVAIKALMKEEGLQGGVQQAIQEFGFLGLLKKLIVYSGGSAESLGKLFRRVEGLKGLMTISKEGFSMVNDKLMMMNESIGMSERAWSLYEKSFAGVMDAFQNTVSKIFTGVGAALAPRAKAVFEALTEGIKSFIDSKTPEQLAQVISSMLEQLAMGMMKILENVTSLIPIMVSGMTMLAKSAAAVAIAFKNWQAILLEVKKTWVEFALGVTTGIKDVVSLIDKLKPGFIKTDKAMIKQYVDDPINYWMMKYMELEEQQGDGLKRLETDWESTMKTIEQLFQDVNIDPAKIEAAINKIRAMLEKGFKSPGIEFPEALPSEIGKYPLPPFEPLRTGGIRIQEEDLESTTRLNKIVNDLLGQQTTAQLRLSEIDKKRLDLVNEYSAIAQEIVDMWDSLTPAQQGKAQTLLRESFSNADLKLEKEGATGFVNEIGKVAQQFGLACGPVMGETFWEEFGKKWKQGSGATGVMNKASALGGIGSAIYGAWQQGKGAGSPLEAGVGGAVSGAMSGVGAAGAMAGAAGASAGAMVAGGLIGAAVIGGIAAWSSSREKSKAAKERREQRQAEADKYSYQMEQLSGEGFYPQYGTKVPPGLIKQNRQMELDEYINRLKNLSQTLSQAIQQAFADAFASPTIASAMEGFADTMARGMSATYLGEMQRINEVMMKSMLAPVSQTFDEVAFYYEKQMREVSASAKDQLIDMMNGLIAPMMNVLAQIQAMSNKFASSNPILSMMGLNIGMWLATMIFNALAYVFADVLAVITKGLTKAAEPLMKMSWLLARRLEKMFDLEPDWIVQLRRAGIDIDMELDKKGVEALQTMWESMTKTIAESLEEGFNSYSKAAGWYNFQKKMKEGIYDFVVEAVTTALAAGLIGLKAIGPILQDLVKLFSTAIVTGVFDTNEFDKLIKKFTGNLDDAFSESEQVFSDVYDTLSDMRREMFWGSQGGAYRDTLSATDTGSPQATDIEDETTTVWQAIKTMMEEFGKLVMMPIEWTVEQMLAIADAIYEAFTDWLDKEGTIGNALKELWGLLTQAWNDFWGGLITTESAGNWFKEAIKAAWDLVLATIGNLGELIGAGIRLSWDAFLALIEGGGAFVGRIVAELGKWWNEMCTSIANGSLIPDLIAGMVEGWVNFWNSIGTAIVDALKAAFNGFMKGLFGGDPNDFLGGPTGGGYQAGGTGTTSGKKKEPKFLGAGILGSTSGGYTPAFNMAFANGLDYVPYDGFPAILHKGEAVLTAAENKGRAGGGVNIVVNANVSSEVDIQVLARKLGRYIEQQQRVSGGY